MTLIKVKMFAIRHFDNYAFYPDYSIFFNYICIATKKQTQFTNSAKNNDNVTIEYEKKTLNTKAVDSTNYCTRSVKANKQL